MNGHVTKVKLAFILRNHYGERWEVQYLFTESPWHKSVSDFIHGINRLTLLYKLRKDYEKRTQVKISACSLPNPPWTYGASKAESSYQSLMVVS